MYSEIKNIYRKCSTNKRLCALISSTTDFKNFIKIFLILCKKYQKTKKQLRLFTKIITQTMKSPIGFTIFVATQQVIIVNFTKIVKKYYCVSKKAKFVY